MNDITSYADKLPPSLNVVLKSFTACECSMVRKIKEKDKLNNRAGNCHVNVKAYVDNFGGLSVSRWILNRNSSLSDRGMFVWTFHSVWQKPDGKWLDVTEDKHYIGRDKSIFIPDSQRVPDLKEGLSHNNFLVIVEPKFAEYYGNSTGFKIITNKVYWTDTVMLRMLDTNEHSGVYRLITPEYPDNIKMMCDEYELEIVNGKPKPKPGSKFEKAGALPIKMIFDYSISSRG